MKKFSLALSGLAAIFSLSFTACGDDKETPATDTSTTDTAVENDTMVEEDVAVVEDTAVEGDTVAPAGLCTNTADLAIITDTSKDPSGKAASCGVDNIADALGGDYDSLETKTIACLKDPTYKGEAKYDFVLSDDCSGCYAASVRCAAEFCLQPCGADPASEACDTCRAENGCYTTFYECSGLTPPTQE